MPPHNCLFFPIYESAASFWSPRRHPTVFFFMVFNMAGKLARCLRFFLHTWYVVPGTMFGITAAPQGYTIPPPAINRPTYLFESQTGRGYTKGHSFGGPFCLPYISVFFFAVYCISLFPYFPFPPLQILSNSILFFPSVAFPKFGDVSYFAVFSCFSWKEKEENLAKNVR